MGNRFRSVSELLQATVHDVFGELVTYRRGTEAVVDVPASRSFQAARTTDAAGALLIGSRIDWILAGPLVIGGTTTTPQDGDRIERTTDDGVLETYEAMPEGSDSSSSESGTGWRIHTKLVGRT